MRVRSIFTCNPSLLFLNPSLNPASPNLDMSMVPQKGLEPPLCCQKQILSLPRLPFRHTRTAWSLMACDYIRDANNGNSGAQSDLRFALVAILAPVGGSSSSP